MFEKKSVMDLQSRRHKYETKYMRISPIRESLDIVPRWPILESEKPDDPFTLFADYRIHEIETPEENKRNGKRKNGGRKKSEKDARSRVFAPLKLFEVPEKKMNGKRSYGKREKIQLLSCEPPFKGPKIITEPKEISFKGCSERWVGSNNNHFKEADEERQLKSKANQTTLLKKTDDLPQIQPKMTKLDTKRSHDYKTSTEPPTAKDVLPNRTFQNECSKVHFTGLVIDVEPVFVSAPHQNETFPSQPYDIGLPNYGNNCFVNATLQVLFAIPHFMNDLERASSRKDDLPENCVTILNEVAKARQNLSVENVNKHFRFFLERLTEIHQSYVTKQQEDASEFLIRLVNVIKVKVPQSPFVSNPIEHHFEFQMAEIQKCPKCSFSFQRSLSYLSIFLNSTSAFLDDCLSDYFQAEQRPISCGQCSSNHMEFFTRFQTLPRVLIVSVNRWTTDLEKVKRPITASPLLLTDKYINDESCLNRRPFTFRAQILHMGQTKHCGHYISQIYCDDNNWRSYSDRDVKVIPTKEVLSPSEAAYVYLYFQQNE